MHILRWSLIAALCCATVLTLWWGWRFLNWVWLRPKRLEKCLREQGFKGTSYKFFFGDIKELTEMTAEAKSKPIGLSDDIIPRITPFVHQSVNKYGKNFFTWIGPRPVLHIMDPDLIREIWSKQYQFQKPGWGGNPLGKLLVTGLADYEGDKWSKHRKIINPAFHIEKLKRMLPAFDLSCSEMIGRWEKLVSGNGPSEVDVWPYIQTLSSDVISRTAFGSSYEEGRRIFELQEEQAELVIKTTQSIYIPGWRFLPTKMNQRMKFIDREVQAAIRNIINKRLKSMEAGECSQDDLLGILLESNNKEIQEHGNKSFGMSTRDVIEECKLFYFAGQETTASLIVWTMILLSLHPNWQKRAREEVFQVFGNSKPDLDGLNQLKIVNLILLEVLRLYPPGTALGRFIYDETKLGEITLPAGVMFQLSIMLLHHDHETWGDDAKQFNPDRFSEGVSNATNGQVSFFPFGWGPRICIGQNFAMLEAKMAIAMILQRFSFSLSPSYSHAPHTIITLQPQYGAHVILQAL